MKKLLVVFLFYAGLISSSLAQAEYVIKFSHAVAPSTSNGKAAQYLDEQVNEKLAGKVRVEVFPNPQWIPYFAIPVSMSLITVHLVGVGVRIWRGDQLHVFRSHLRFIT